MRNEVSAAARARWLAQLAQVLERAQIVVEHMPIHAAGSDERRELLHRIDGARRATASLRLASERRLGRMIAPD